MALYIRGNRILTQEEKNNEDMGDGCASAVLLFLAVLFVLSPGILVTSLLSTFIDFTTSQLWGTAIVSSIVIGIGVAWLNGGNDIVKGYLITALCCSLFMFIYYLFKPNNCYYDTINKMLNVKSSDNESPHDGEASDSIAYSPSSSSTNNYTANNQSNTETEEEYEEPDYEEEVEENYSSNETAMNEESSYSGKSETNKVVETMPTFPGGNEALMKYLSDNVKVPLDAEENGIQGKVVVSYVIDFDGSVIDVQVVQSVHPVLDEEAVRVVKNMPKWTAGTRNGMAVRTKYSIPINFRFQ